VTQAKIEQIKRSGGNDFASYMLPEAILRLKQGFGRLIRTRGDRGIVAILDPRIKAKGYGQRFLRSLPRCREITSLENVDLFLKRDPQLIVRIERGAGE
jgi:ATP-dependent DNA helicase DinG